MATRDEATDLLSRVRADFIGLDTEYTLADGRRTRRIYLDSTASTLMMGVAHEAIEQFLEHYANTHSLLHFPARIASREYRWAHERVMSFLGADPETYTCFFTGSGTTAGINRMARVLRLLREDRPVVLVSLMEHHSNDLPHRRHAEKVVHLPLEEKPGGPGGVSMKALEEELDRYGDKVNYVAVTAVSNVTGIINPISEIAEMAHRHGALILVDGAQSAAHVPVQMSGNANPAHDVDVFVFSGHKTYVPGSPGVVVCRKEILSGLEPVEVGGGMVDRVFVDRYTPSKNFPDREEAGTPNIPGAIALGTVLEVLDAIGMQTVYEDETRLIHYALGLLREIPGVKIYGEPDDQVCPRAASISFNILGMDHGLVAAVLNDYYNISVRNECFCAHPYVKEMVIEDLMESVEEIDEEDFEAAVFLKSGMLRASFGLYNDEADADALAAAVRDVVEKKETYAGLYTPDDRGDYWHNSFRPSEGDQFSARDFVHCYLNGGHPGGK
jgi:selenocysteine lyase/cysteine desulfurase